MAGRGAERRASAAASTSGAVLSVSFIAPKTYLSTWYPHPTPRVANSNDSETRYVAMYASPFNQTRYTECLTPRRSKNLPLSLLKSLREAIDETRTVPGSQLFTLKPEHYLMHIFCWRPHGANVQDAVRGSFDKCPEALWLVYSMLRSPHDQWNNDPSKSVTIEPGQPERLVHRALGQYVNDIKKDAVLGGNLSHVSLGETSDAFFIRVSDNKGNWHYRYSGLSQTASWLYKSPWLRRRSATPDPAFPTHNHTMARDVNTLPNAITSHVFTSQPITGPTVVFVP